jgi:hypothetical protein
LCRQTRFGGPCAVEKEDELRRIFAFMIAAAMPLCTASGCEEDHTSYCEAKIDCENGTQDDLDICNASVESEREMSEKCGCAELYGAWIDCLLEEGSCKSTGFILSEEDGGVIWETDPNGAGQWVTDASCTEMANAMYLCETDAGLDPNSGGECGD